MKESIRDLVKECIYYCDITALLIDLDNHLSNIKDNNNNNDIVFNYYNDKWEFWGDLNKLSLEDLKQFISALEDEFVVYLLTLPQSFKTKLYDQINMESCV